MNNYESRRLTISYLAVQELRQMFGIPEDAPTQALSAAVEKLIFQGGGINKPALQTAPIQPNKAGLAGLAKQAA